MNFPPRVVFSAEVRPRIKGADLVKALQKAVARIINVPMSMATLDFYRNDQSLLLLGTMGSIGQGNFLLRADDETEGGILIHPTKEYFGFRIESHEWPDDAEPTIHDPGSLRRRMRSDRTELDVASKLFKALCAILEEDYDQHVILPVTTQDERPSMRES